MIMVFRENTVFEGIQKEGDVRSVSRKTSTQMHVRASACEVMQMMMMRCSINKAQHFQKQKRSPQHWNTGPTGYFMSSYI